MGARGPKPLPLEIHKVRGTARRDRMPTRRAEFAPASLVAPAHLAGAALEIWNAHAPALRAQGLLRRPDVILFGTLCVCAARVIELEQKTVEVGIDVAIQKGYRKAVAVERQLLRALCSEFAMSPAARVRVEADPPATPGPPSKWDGLLGDRAAQATP